MAFSVDTIFGRPMVESSDQQANRVKAAQGFTQVFAAILAKQMRESSLGADNGPMGTGGGVSGDVYGAFFDQAIAGVLAKSSAMRDLNSSIVRELGGSNRLDRSADPSRETGVTKIVQRPGALSDNLSLASGNSVLGSDPTLISALSASAGQMSADLRGPVLLPPKPSSMAFFLPPP